ncbi:MAG: SDR family oxidoreductase [Pseudobacteriovorax sp.]|nr:SDR family oxidoreductase [Pseudobacteriovorax sp.]
MKTVLVTGVTGFVGSALAAGFIKNGIKVVAISRNDNSGWRTLKAIEEAVAQTQNDFSRDIGQMLEVISIEYEKIEDLSKNPLLDEIDEVWHSAAEMTYSKRKLNRSFAQNLEKTSRLYKIMARSKKCKRFYYISTAYTGGIDDQMATEELHVSPILTNSYQASKWAAEMSLAQCNERWKLPVTIFRPSIVVGDEFTGWRGKSSFGFYVFVENLMNIRELGVDQVQIDLDPNALVNLIPVNRVVDYAIKLSQSDSIRDSFEVVHASSGKPFTVVKLAERIEVITGLKIFFGKPITKLDRMLANGVKQNKYFAGRSWHFNQCTMKKVLKRDYEDFKMDATILDIIICRFLWSDDVVIRRKKLMKKRHLRFSKKMSSIYNLQTRIITSYRSKFELSRQSEALNSIDLETQHMRTHTKIS